MKGVVRPPSPKKRFTRFSAMALCSPLTLLASALAPVTTMPPPMPSRNSSSRIGRNPDERGRQEQRNGDARETEDEPDFVALGIEQRPNAERGDDEAKRLHEGDGAILRGREVEALRKLGQNGAQHGGDHSVDKDGQNCGKDQHGTGPFRYRRQGYGMGAAHPSQISG